MGAWLLNTNDLWIQNIKNRTFQKCKVMASKQSLGDINSFNSLLSSEAFDDMSIKNDLSFKLYNEEELINMAFGSQNEIRIEESGQAQTKLPQMELRRCTSFEEMLMENHRTILIDSIRQYFEKTQHCFLKSVKSLKQFSARTTEDEANRTAQNTQLEIGMILSQNEETNELLQNRIMDRLRENHDEMNIAADMMRICPKKIEFEVLFLICFILQDCNEIIQHFKKRNLARELKDRSIKLAGELREMPCLEYLFDSEKEASVAGHFECLVQKWMITLFLMKVGVFENGLQTKSIDDCLKSDVFSNIDLNDLLNQHLIRPLKRTKKD